MGPLQHLLNRTDAHHKWLAEAAKGRAQLYQAFAAKFPLPGGAIWLAPQVWLHHVERQHWSPQRRLQ
jgi:hypothetical protein